MLTSTIVIVYLAHTRYADPAVHPPRAHRRGRDTDLFVSLAASTNTAGLYARLGGRAPGAIRLSAHTARRIRGRSGGRVLDEQPLAPGAPHHVLLTVRGSGIVALVDGAVRLSAPSRHGAGGIGGIALSIVRDRAGRSSPDCA